MYMGTGKCGCYRRSKQNSWAVCHMWREIFLVLSNSSELCPEQYTRICIIRFGSAQGNEWTTVMDSILWGITWETKKSSILYNSECVFMVNATTTARIDAKHSGITKNNPENVLRKLKSLILVLSGRYHEISGFFFAVNCHLCLSPFHFQILPRLLLTQSTFAKTPSAVRRSISASTIIYMYWLHVYTQWESACVG